MEQAAVPVPVPCWDFVVGGLWAQWGWGVLPVCARERPAALPAPLKGIPGQRWQPVALSAWGLRAPLNCLGSGKLFFSLIQLSRSDSRQQFRKGHIECRREQLEIPDADFFLAVLQVRNKTAIHANVLGHIDLRPAALLPQPLQPLAESNTDIAGHLTMMAVVFRL